MPTTRANIPMTRSGHARLSPPVSKAPRKRANTAASENTSKRPKPNVDDDETEGNKTKGGRDGKKSREKERGKGQKQRKA
ncbi:hypothetical protein K443DRAFT_11263, partial [Laccaria amethystina LaAM-08-1]